MKAITMDMDSLERDLDRACAVIDDGQREPTEEEMNAICDAIANYSDALSLDNAARHARGTGARS